MKSIKSILIASVVLAASAFTLIQTINWKVKPDYSVKISSPKIHGSFTGLNATIVFDEAHLDKSKIHASIDANTLKTGKGLMDEHAKSEDGLNAAKFPAIVFESKSISKTNAGYEAAGDLTLKGVTKEIKIPFTFVNETFAGKFTIEPKDYNVTRGGTPDKMDIELNIPVSK